MSGKKIPQAVLVPGLNLYKIAAKEHKERRKQEFFAIYAFFLDEA